MRVEGGGGREGEGERESVCGRQTPLHISVLEANSVEKEDNTPIHFFTSCRCWLLA